MASEEKKVERTGTPQIEAKPVDERASKLASQSEAALANSAKAEGAIAASQTLAIYATAGLAHLETIRCFKSSIDYACETRGVSTTWTASEYESAVDQITVRVRAANPELFTDFDALKETPSSPSKNRERIHTRLLVGIVFKRLVEIVGDTVGNLPYRIVANYMVSDRVLKFSKSDVIGEIRTEHVEFLRVQVGQLAAGKSTSASFLNALKGHFAGLDKESADKSASNLTPAERALRESAAKEGREAAATQEKIGKVRKTLAKYLATSCTGVLSPDEIAKLVTEAAAKAKISLPIGKLNPKNVTKEELNSYLEQVAKVGGKSPEERKSLRMVIVRHGSILAEQANKHKAAKMATNAATNSKPQLAAAAH